MFDIDLKKLIPKVMNNDFWNDLCDTLSDELTIIRDFVSSKSRYYDLSYQKDKVLYPLVFGVGTDCLSGMEITGATEYNTDNYVLYWSLSDINGNHRLSIYKDFAKSSLVMQSQIWTGTSETVLTLSEANSSAISGTVTCTFSEASVYFKNYILLSTEDITNFINISKMYGFDPDVSISNDPYYLQRIIYAIPIFIKSKAMYKNYYIAFKLAKFQGDVFNIYYNGFKLIRAQESYITDLEAARTGNLLGNGFYLYGQKNYDLFVQGDQYLDTIPPVTLDAATTWYLDQSFSRLTTKHLAVEFFMGTYIDDNEENTFNLIEKFNHIGTGDSSTVTFSQTIYNMPTNPVSELFKIYNGENTISNLSIGAADQLGNCAITGTGLASGNYNNSSKTVALTFSTAPDSGKVIKCSYLHSMTMEYMGYLNSMANYNMKVVDVLHVGSQMSFIMDTSGYKDCITPESAHTFPDMKMDCSVTTQFIPNFSVFSNIGRVAFGNGNHAIPSAVSGTPFSENSLDSEVYSVTVQNEELAQFGDESWYMISASANSNKIREEINSGEPDGNTIEFSGMLSYPPIMKKTVKITVTQNTEEKDIIDQSQDAIGFYSYSESETYEKENVYSVDTINTVSYTLTETNIVPFTVAMSFVIDGTTYTVYDSTTDNVDGSFMMDGSNPGTDFITSGTINYQKSQVEVTFTTNTDSLSEVKFNYSYVAYDVTTLDKQAYAEINYETGAYTIYMKYDVEDEEIISTTSMLEITDWAIGVPQNAILKPNSLLLTFYMPDGSMYTARDIVIEGSGGTLGEFDVTTNIASSSINYETNVFSVTFNQNTSFLNNITLGYTYTILNPPDNYSKIYVEYVTEQNIKITEAGVFDTYDNLIAYGTFPPIEMNDPKFHTSYQFFIYYGGTFN